MGKRRASRRGDSGVTLETYLWDVFARQIRGAGVEITPEVERAMRGLVRNGVKNLKALSDEPFMTHPEEVRRAEQALARFADEMERRASARRDRVVDLETYQQIYAGICPIFPIC